MTGLSNDFSELLRIAQQNFKEAGAFGVAVHCENCGRAPPEGQQLERCDRCLFYWCLRCLGSRDHLTTHAEGVMHEDREAEA